MFTDSFFLDFLFFGLYPFTLIGLGDCPLPDLPSFFSLSLLRLQAESLADRDWETNQKKENLKRMNH